MVGSPNSSNSKRLAEIARNRGRPAYLVDGPEQIQATWFAGVETVAVTAGASRSGGRPPEVYRPPATGIPGHR